MIQNLCESLINATFSKYSTEELTLQRDEIISWSFKSGNRVGCIENFSQTRLIDLNPLGDMISTLAKLLFDGQNYIEEATTETETLLKPLFGEAYIFTYEECTTPFHPYRQPHMKDLYYGPIRVAVTTA